MAREKDLIIVGGGPAGLSAALYSKRYGIDFSLVEKLQPGGQILLTYEIENYPGFLEKIPYKLVENMNKQIKEVEIINDEIINVKKEGERFLLKGEKEYLSKSVIWATGAVFKKLGVKGEKEFTGKGVSYCATCDGFFFKDRVVGVVGGGDSAVEEALYLSNICKKVYLFHRRDKLRATKILQERIFNKNNVEIVLNSIVKEIRGREKVEEVLFEVKEKGEKVFPLDGIFIFVGMVAQNGAVKELFSLDTGEEFIKTDEEMKTVLEGFFACGDCRKRPLYQVITAVSEGAIASFSVYKYLSK